MLDDLQYNAVDFATVAPQMRHLWREAFADDDYYMDNFMSIMDAEQHLHTLTVGGRLVSMLFALPYKVWHKGSEILAAYIYAVATDAAFAGNGCMRLLLQCVHDNLRFQGYAAIFLVPGEGWLFDYYARLGYEMCAWYDIEQVERDANFPISNDRLFKEHSLTDEIYTFIISCAKEADASILHSRESLAMNIFNCEMSGGGLYILKEANEISAVGFVVDNSAAPLLIAEFSKDGEARRRLLQHICVLLGTEAIHSRIPTSLGTARYAMAYRINDTFPSKVSMQLLLDV